MILNIPDNVLKDQSLPSSAKLLYGLLLRLKNDTGDNMCRLSAQLLADGVGVERATVPRLVRVLETKGLLSVHEGLSMKNRLQYVYEVIEVKEETE